MRLPQIPEDLSALSNDELSALLTECRGAFEEAAPEGAQLSVEDLSTLSSFADDVARIQEESTKRDSAAEEQNAQLSSLRSRIGLSHEGENEGDGEGDAKKTDKPAGDGEGENEKPAQGDKEGEKPADGENASGSANATDGQPSIPAEGQPAADTGARTVHETSEVQANPGVSGENSRSVTAGGTMEKLQRNAPARTRPRAAEPVGSTSLVAAANVPGVVAGTNVKSMRDAAEMLIKRKRGLGAGDEDNVPVVTFNRELPNERVLSSDMSGDEIFNRIKSFDRTPEGIQAAGGLCAPVNSYYNQMVIAGTDRPVRDALAAFQADRGGIRFNPPPKLSSVTSGVGVVTAAQDLAGGGGAQKNCFTVTCPSISEVDVAAIYNCLTFGNFGARAFPEQVEAWTELALSLQARTAEQLLLDGIAAASTTVTAQGYVGAGREIFAIIGRAAAGYRSRNRMAVNAPLTVLLPSWVGDLVQADFARTFTDEPGLISLTDNDLVGLFGTRGLQVSWYLDSKTGGGQVFGAAQGGQTYTDAVTNGTTTVTSATAAFTSSDVGKTVTGTNIPANTTISSVTNATTIVLSQAATGSATGGLLTVGRTTLQQFPNQVFGYLFAPGSFLHLDAGTLDLGLVRDSTLNTTNQFRLFTESFENVALVGPESLEVAMTLYPDGSYGAAKSVPTPLNQ